MTDHTDAPDRSPDASQYAPELRHRAHHLTALAAAIERSLVMHLLDDARPIPSSREGRLCQVLLERNLHQLHRAADDLRSTALRYRTTADELDTAFEAVA